MPVILEIEDKLVHKRLGMRPASHSTQARPMSGSERSESNSEGSLHLDYLYNNGNSANNALEPYDHILSLWPPRSCLASSMSGFWNALA